MQLSQPLTLDQAELLADKVRTSFWAQGKFPVDPITIASDMGLSVMDVELPDTVAGALLKKVGEDPIIMLHVDDHEHRKRFTCSHELGHFVYRLERGQFEGQEIDHVDYRDEASASGDCDEEISANRFAAALLMPQQKVKELHKKAQNKYVMAKFFRVSVTAMGVRLESLGLA